MVGHTGSLGFVEGKAGRAGLRPRLCSVGSCLGTPLSRAAFYNLWKHEYFTRTKDYLFLSILSFPAQRKFESDFKQALKKRSPLTNRTPSPLPATPTGTSNGSSSTSTDSTSTTQEHLPAVQPVPQVPLPAVQLAPPGTSSSGSAGPQVPVQ